MIRVFISREDGSIHTDFQGYHGKACLADAEKLFKDLQDLGIQTNSEKFTPKPELQEVERDVIQH